MRYIFTLVLFLPLLTQAATTHSGQVVAITDGDTIKILTPEKKQVKVRLASIDTPEKGQPYGQKAKQILSDKIFGKQVRVEKITTDRYKRIIGKVYLDDRYINAEMVADGYAWVYRNHPNLEPLSNTEVDSVAPHDGQLSVYVILSIVPILSSSIRTA